MLIVYGRLEMLREHYPGLIQGLVEASRYDPYKVRAFGPKSGPSHGDGWGRVIVAAGSGKIAISYYRSLSPIYVDRPQASPPEVLREVSDPLIIDMLHARAASGGTPVNIFSVQPFEYHTSSGARLFLIHNGSVDKEKLASELKGSYGGLDRYSDTYVMGLWLAKNLGDNLDESLIAKLKDYTKNYTKTALNLALVLIAPSRMELIAGGYYQDNSSQEKKSYYKLYTSELGGEGIIVASSTLVNKYRPNTIRSWRELENGAYYHITIELKEEDELRSRLTKFKI